MKTLLKSVAATLVLATSFTNIKPLSETTAKVISVAGGCLVGAGTGAATYYGLQGMQSPGREIATGLASVGAGGLTWFALDRILYGYTPPGRVLYAADLIQTIKNDLLLSSKSLNESELITQATSLFGGSWPIVQTRQRLIKMQEQLEDARSNLTTALAEIAGNGQYATLTSQGKELLSFINPIKTQINDKLGVLINSKDYKFQVALYEKHMEAERQRSHESNLQFNNHLHDSCERQKDRNFKRTENNKDRLHSSLENYLDRDIMREIFN